MVKSTGSDGKSLLWRAGLFLPLSVGFALLWIASARRDVHVRALFVVIATLLNAVSVGVQGAYWLFIRKSVAIAIIGLLAAGLLFGFALQTLPKALAHAR